MNISIWVLWFHHQTNFTSPGVFGNFKMMTMGLIMLNVNRICIIKDLKGFDTRVRRIHAGDNNKGFDDAL